MDERPTKRQWVMDTESTVNGQLDVTKGTVQIKVGKGSKSKVFHIHETVLKKGSSPFFRTTLKGEWKKRRGDDQTMGLKHHCPTVFKAYIKWVYSGIHAASFLDEPGSLVSAYPIGEEILDREFQNAVITCLLKAPEMPGHDLVDTAYDMSPEGSPLRRVFVDKWAQTQPSYIREHLNCEYDHKFVIDVAIAVAEERSSGQEHRSINPSLENKELYLHKDL